MKWYGDYLNPRQKRLKIENFSKIDSNRRCTQRGFSKRKPGCVVKQCGEVIEPDSSLCGMNCSGGEQAHHFIKESIARVGDAVAVFQGAQLCTVNGAAPVDVWGFISTIPKQSDRRIMNSAFKSKGEDELNPSISPFVGDEASVHGGGCFPTQSESDSEV
jgi:hypothetical protein